MSDVDQSIESGVTRREILKKGAALGGALVWGAPVVQVIGMRPALAQTPSPVCPNLYCVKAEWRGGQNGSLGSFQACSKGFSRGQGNCLVPPDPGKAELDFDVPSSILDGIDVTHGVECNGSDGVLITLPLGCRLAGVEDTGTPDPFVGSLSAAAKCGKKGSRDPLDWCDGPIEVGQDSDGRVTLCFSIRCRNETTISHIELFICCPDGNAT
jgi:hypothetical protein